MRMRLHLVSVFALGLVVVLAGLLLDRRPAPPDPTPIAFPALASHFATADRIELVHGGQVLWLERRGQVWALARQGGYPARPNLTKGLIDALLTMRLMQPVPDTFESLKLADPFAPGANSGTFIRVLGTSGMVLCAVIAGPPGSAVVRRPGDDHAWLANNPVIAPASAEQWSQHALPPLDPAQIRGVLADGGLGSAAVKAAVAEIPFVDVAPAPQHHPAPVRTIQLALSSGTAVLTIGLERGQPWLLVSGSSAWASRLTPYAFALPNSTRLAVF